MDYLRDQESLPPSSQRSLHLLVYSTLCTEVSKWVFWCSFVFHLLTFITLLSRIFSGKTNILKSGLMNEEQYGHAEEDLFGRMQLMKERESGNIVPIDVSSTDSDSDCMDDPVIRSLSTERQQAIDEFGSFCNLCKMQRNRPKAYLGETLKLGPCDMKYPITMGKVGVKGDDIVGNPPFVRCNLSDYIGDDGRFNLVSFLNLQ